MKRCMNLVRALLLFTENQKLDDIQNQIRISGYTDDEINYHIYIMKDGGLIEGHVIKASGNLMLNGTISNLTWQGHEFLDASRDEKIWKKSIQAIKSKSLELPFLILKELLFSQLRNELGIQ